MVISPIDKVQSRQNEELSSAKEELTHLSKKLEQHNSGVALHQLFDQDLLEKSELQTKAPSLWNRLAGWWQGSSSTTGSTPLAPSTATPPISTIPVLDPPEMDLGKGANFTLPPAAKRTLTPPPLSQGELMEALSLMSEKSIEEIMFIILQAQIELEKENANIVDTTLTKYQDFKKLQDKVLQEIKDVLAKDKALAGKLKTAQNIAFAAVIVFGLVATAASAGMLAPLGATGVWIAGTLGPAASAAFSGLVTGTKAYFDRRSNEDQAKHEEFSHKDKYLNDRLEDAHQLLISTADADNVFKERMIRLLRRTEKMQRIVLQKI